MRTIKTVLLCLLFLSSCLDARTYKQERESLERSLVEPPFRIFYTLKGKHALSDTSDLNQNEIPDYIEDTMRHLQLANFIFKNIIGLREPLQSPKYKDVEYIDVNVVNLKNKRHLGQAVDAVIVYQRPKEVKTTKALSMDIRPNLDSRTFTPIHELFHLYQNGYNMIKNPWLVEGLARVAQRAFGYYRLTRVGSPDLPKTKKERDILYAKSYDAFFFWNKLMYRLYGKTSIPHYDKIMAEKYIDGRYILNDFSMNGFAFLPQLMSELEILEREIEEVRGIKKYKWSAREQLTTENNDYIWLAIKKSIVRHHYERIKSSPELQALFLIE